MNTKRAQPLRHGPLLMAVLLAACPTSKQAQAVPDTGVLVDAGDARDTGLADTGAFDQATGSDALIADATPADAAVSDAAVTDATRSDLGRSADATPPQADAGLPPQGENIFANGSFESWTDGLPDGWLGAETNLPSDAILENTSSAHDGLRSCQLANNGSSHKRFTSAAMSLAAGRYHCSYWVKGRGEIRNARFTGSYSSYSSYHSVDTATWEQIRYNFNVATDINEVFELIFSLRNTDSSQQNLRIDDVRCTRDIEACDVVTCEAWQSCDNDLAACITASGFCAEASECQSWQDCDASHRCVTATGRCAATADCDDATPVCDLDTHLCVTGDPCANVTCVEYKQCDPADASCVLGPDRCLNTSDCHDALPVCDVSTHSCEAVDHASNVVPNGGFELWEDVWLWGPTSTTHHLPQYWYGVCDGCSPYYPSSEIDPANVRPYTSNPHGGSSAVQLVKAGQPGDRFVSEPFAVTPSVTYSCSYRVRGQGSHRQRAYCGGWEPDTSYQPVDSDTWQVVDFEINATSSWCVLIFYVSNTDATREHVQIDDVVCSKKF